RPRVVMQNSAYDSMRTLQTMTVSRAPTWTGAGLEAHLRLVNGRIVGTLHNGGDRPLQQVMLVSGTGQQSTLTPDLGPRATAAVDASLDAPNQRPYDPGGGTTGTDFRRASLLRIAIGQATDSRQGVFSLVALTESFGSLEIDGTHPSHSSVAAVVQPVSLDSADSLSGIALRPELVAQTDSIPFHYDVYDLKVPPGYSGPVKLQYVAYPSTGSSSAFQPPVKSVEVYDWTADSWRALPAAAAGQAQRPLSIDLKPGEAVGGV